MNDREDEPGLGHNNPPEPTVADRAQSLKKKIKKIKTKGKVAGKIKKIKADKAPKKAPKKAPEPDVAQTAPVDEAPPKKASGGSGAQVRKYVKSIEAVNDQVRDLRADISEFFHAAKDAGLDTKALRALIKLRRQDAEAMEAFQETLDEYTHAMESKK